jgi:pimeloyl-ACP methyl ester carboxylesterase
VIRPTTHEIRAEGFRYGYRLFRSPASLHPPVFICNGFLQTMESWLKYVPLFTREATVLIADLPGAGTADPIPEGQFDLRTLGRCVAAILEREQIGRIDIIAASYGAAIGYSFAQHYPAQVKHLVLAGVMQQLDEGARRQIERGIAFLQQKDMKRLAETVTGMLLNGNEEDRIPRSSIVRKLLCNQLVRLPESYHHQHIINARHLLQHPPLAIALDPGIRSLIVTGEFDLFAHPSYGRAIASRLVHAAFTTIRNADHLFHLEQTQTTFRLIDAFFRDRPVETVPGINGVEYFGWT